MRTNPVAAVITDAADDISPGASHGIGRSPIGIGRSPVSIGADIVRRRRDGHHGSGHVIRNRRRCVDDRWRGHLAVHARPALDVFLPNITIGGVRPAVDILGRMGFVRKDVGRRCRSDSNDGCGERAQRRSHCPLR
jgi:hypothetical protein